MLNRFLTICFFFVFSLSSSVQVLWAQNTEAGEGLSLGLAVTTPEIGQPYIAERIGDWNLRCIRTRDGNDPCELTQIIICLLYTSPSPRDRQKSRMPSSA